MDLHPIPFNTCYFIGKKKVCPVISHAYRHACWTAGVGGIQSAVKCPLIDLLFKLHHTGR